MKQNPQHDTAADLGTILKVFRGDRLQAHRFAQLYVDHTPGYADSLTAAVRDSDLDGIIRASHGIRGSAAMVGAARLRDLAESMETLGRVGDLDRAQSVCQPLLDELDRSCRLLSDYATLLLELERISGTDASTTESVAGLRESTDE